MHIFFVHNPTTVQEVCLLLIVFLITFWTVSDLYCYILRIVSSTLGQVYRYILFIFLTFVTSKKKQINKYTRNKFKKHSSNKCSMEKITSVWNSIVSARSADNFIPYVLECASFPSFHTTLQKNVVARNPGPWTIYVFLS